MSNFPAHTCKTGKSGIETLVPLVKEFHFFIKMISPFILIVFEWSFLVRLRAYWIFINSFLPACQPSADISSGINPSAYSLPSEGERNHKWNVQIVVTGVCP